MKIFMGNPLANNKTKNIQMRSTFLFIALIAATIAGAQNSAATKYAKTITPSDLKAKLTIIASAAMEGRETATEGQRKAAAYIENYFKKLGLQPGNGNSYQMSFPVYKDSVTNFSFTVNGKEFKTGEDVATLGRNIPEGKWNVKDIVFASYGTTDSLVNNYDGLNVKGKWVLVLDYKTKEGASLYDIVSHARQQNAAGLLVLSPDFPKQNYKLEAGMRNTEEKGKSMPMFYVSNAVAEALLGKTPSASTIRGVYPANLALNIEETTQHLQSTNVLGVLPGTDKKDEYVFVTGHYDHLGKRDSVIYYGADDDGSGTTSVLEIAEAFSKAKKAGHGPRRTMVFMTVSGEEKGLWGSEYYAANPIFPLDRTSVDLNIDMVGRIDPDYKGDSTNYVYVIGEDKLSSDLFPISDSINKKYINLELDRRYNDPKDPNRFYYRSDHFNFAKNGVPVIFYFNGVHADYHKPTDTIDKINFDVMTKRVKLIYYTAWAMANRDDLLKRDIPLSH